MRGVRMLLGARLRRRWRSAVLLAVALGVGGGAVLALGAGARRTETSYDRFLAAENGADIIVTSVGRTAADTAPALSEVARLPQVAAASRADSILAQIRVRGALVGTSAARVIATEDTLFGTDVDRFTFLSGGMWRPGHPDEAVAAWTLADSLGLRVGDTVQLVIATQAEIAQAANIPIVRGLETIARHPLTSVRIVGIEVSPAPSDLPPTSVDNPPDLYLSPAFYAAHHADLPPYDGLLVRLHGGQGDVAAFKTAVERIGHGSASYISTADQRLTVVRGITIEAGALAVIAGLTALTLACVLAQTMSRHLLLASADFAALRALGMTPRQLMAVHLVWSLGVGVLGAVVAGVVAVAASPLFPVGTARLAEPSPGIDGDWLVLGAGSAMIVLLALMLTVAPSLRAVEQARGGVDRPRAAGPSRLAEVLGGLRLPASATVGVRLALSPGHGRSSVPVRAAVAGCAVAVATVVAALSFDASARSLLDTPRLYGWNWDVAVTEIMSAPDVDAGQYLRPVHGVGDLSGVAPLDVAVDGTRVPVIVAWAYRGSIAPTLTEGRAPVGADEILLGATTGTGIGVGDTVSVSVGDQTAMMRVVGRGVLPALGGAQLGNGGWMTVTAARRLAADVLPYTYYVRYRAGSDPAEVNRAIERAVGPGTVLAAQRPTDVSDFGNLGVLPLVLPALLAAAGAATLMHTLVTSVHRRRRDLAVLKTLGFTRSQIVVAVAWQAATLAGLAGLVGIPAGVAAGRWAWTIAVERIGSSGDATVPASLVLVAPALVVVAIATALLPARLAARTAPATVLRAE